MGQPVLPHGAGALAAIGISGTNVCGEGFFRTAGGIGANRVVKWNSVAWEALAAGVNGPFRALALSGNNANIGGDFTSTGGATW